MRDGGRSLKRNTQKAVDNQGLTDVPHTRGPWLPNMTKKGLSRCEYLWRVRQNAKLNQEARHSLKPLRFSASRHVN